MLYRTEFAGFDQQDSPRLFVEEVMVNQTASDSNVLTKIAYLIKFLQMGKQ